MFFSHWTPDYGSQPWIVNQKWRAMESCMKKQACWHLNCYSNWQRANIECVSHDGARWEVWNPSYWTLHLTIYPNICCNDTVPQQKTRLFQSWVFPALKLSNVQPSSPPSYAWQVPVLLGHSCCFPPHSPAAPWVVGWFCLGSLQASVVRSGRVDDCPGLSFQRHHCLRQVDPALVWRMQLCHEVLEWKRNENHKI